MESEFSPDNNIHVPPVPLKTYQWEDLRRARDAGGYPWTHLLKPPLEGEITAEDIIRETTPRRSMSREISRSRTHSPADFDDQRILNLDSSPGSSRRHGEEGEDEGIQIPNFSKEVSLDSEEEPKSVKAYIVTSPASSSFSQLAAPTEIPKSISPKSILKRRIPEQQYVPVTETREKTKCCHPLVNKIKHLADKTLHKLDKNDNEKSPVSKRKKNDDVQEIMQLKSSPGAVRRQKYSAIKLGDSDEMSKTMSVDSTPPLRKKKEHVYEDIEDSNNKSYDKSSLLSKDVFPKKYDNETNNSNKENQSFTEKKSVTSQDPSLVTDDIDDMHQNEPIMQKLHKREKTSKEALVLDVDTEEPNFDELFQNQLDELEDNRESPNITITEIFDDDTTNFLPSPDEDKRPSSQLQHTSEIQNNRADNHKDWSKICSDHEYEIIEKPPPSAVYKISSGENKPLVKTDDELSSTTSLERKYLQHTSDEDEHFEEEDKIGDQMIAKENQDIMNAETLQKDIEDRYFISTPSTVSRTECDISTSQVDSSALENLPLKRDSRQKSSEQTDSNLQKHFRESTGKLKNQANKLKSKFQSIKTKKFSMERPKINLPERPRFKMPDRPKISFPERPKFLLPERRKTSLPERPKLKKMNISDKFSLRERKFSFPERPKFNVPDMPKFKLPERPKINFPSLRKKKEYKIKTESTESSPDLTNIATVEFEVKTYPRLFGRKKKQETLTSSSPALDREDTPPPTFTFTRVKDVKKTNVSHEFNSSEQPREYGKMGIDNYDNESETMNQFETTYDFDKTEDDFEDKNNQNEIHDESAAASMSDLSPSKQEYTHVINEINNDEFFVRPRGISHENIQMREYLSDEIRQAFNIPKNALALMSCAGENEDHMYANETEMDPELLDENEIRYSNEDLNERDDGYYTFPPIRPSRAKRKKKDLDSVQYIDDNVNDTIQFSEVDLAATNNHLCSEELPASIDSIQNFNNFIKTAEYMDSESIENTDIQNDVSDYPIQSQTLPTRPKRKKKKQMTHSSFNDLKRFSDVSEWDEPQKKTDDIIVYRTEHEYVVPNSDIEAVEPSPVPPHRVRNRSRSSHCTSLCDDDRTSRGAESLTLDTNLPQTEEVDFRREIRHESPGYATVDKYVPNKFARRSKSKTPPVRRRKSHSSERKYYTVGPTKEERPNRPPRKKSSTSLMTLNTLTKQSLGSDITQYVEIDEPQFEDVHKDLKSGEIVNKMKDRPLPPPPRPPRGPKRKKNFEDSSSIKHDDFCSDENLNVSPEDVKISDVQEIEVSTQTDPLPDDMDFELGIDDNLDVSVSSSLHDIVDEESVTTKSPAKPVDSPRFSRTTSRSEKSLKFSDPKISELTKTSIGRSSPTIILVEKRVSSPTRINEREVMVTEASLTVQHIDVDESLIPDVPPLPKSRGTNITSTNTRNMANTEERALERISDSTRDIQLENLITQRLQVRDLDVGRLNVNELQATKISVSDIEGMTLQVNELDSKSGHLSVSGIEFSQSVIDEIVKKFAELAPTNIRLTDNIPEHSRPISREEETQTDTPIVIKMQDEIQSEAIDQAEVHEQQPRLPPLPIPPKPQAEETSTPPQRPPPPDLTPLLYSYLQDISVPSIPFYPLRMPRERPLTEYTESQHQAPPPPTRKTKRKPAPKTESSSEESRPRPSPRRMQPPAKMHEPTIIEAGAQFLRVCQNSVVRTIRSMFNSLMSYISGTEDKKDIQMALVIFLVLVAGLIMFGLSDSRTIHHHHWEFFNPPDGNP